MCGNLHPNKDHMLWSSKIGRRAMKTNSMAPLLVEGFPMVSREQQEVGGMSLGDLNLTNKQNKQTCLPS